MMQKLGDIVSERALAAFAGRAREVEALLQLFEKGGPLALYNHRSGFFAQSDLTWFIQDNRERSFSSQRLATHDLPSDEFPQWNIALGWHFPGQRGDLTFGVHNITDRNYHLSPVNYYNEMPHERVFYGRMRFRF